jgi:hypothetical protein
MTELIWLLGTSAAVTIWVYGRPRLRRDDLGALSARWLHDYHRECHHEG